MPLSAPLASHHKHCDELFAAAEAAAHARRWSECSEACRRFCAGMEIHFAVEEDLLFPAFETVSGMTGGPTQVMRFEHAQMRALLFALTSAAEAADLNALSGAAETLLVLMQQHNMKEENILYPMCDQALADTDLPIAARLKTAA